MSNKGHRNWALILVIMLAVMYGLGAKAFGATIDGLYDEWVLNNVDSVRWYLQRVSDTANIDSGVITPAAKNVTIAYSYDDQTLYNLKLHYWFTGYTDKSSDTWPVPAISGLWASQGEGAYTVDYYVLDTTNSETTAVFGAFVTFKAWDALGGAVVRSASTDANGKARISVDADSLAALVTVGNLYTFPTAWDSMSWTANYQDTLFGYVSLPSAATDSNYVLLYMDIGSGIIDSAAGTMIARDRITLVLELLGGAAFYDAAWVMVPKTQRKQPNSSGRVTFSVPATTTLTSISGGIARYRLTYEAFDGRSLQSGHIKTFVLDTTPDPINVLNATEVF